MRIPRILIAASALLALSGCSEAKYQDFRDWYSSKPSHMEYKWGPMTTGYFGQNKAGWAVLKPPAERPPLREDREAVPLNNTVVEPLPGPGVQVNDSVSVYPLDHETEVAPQPLMPVEPAPVEPQPVVAEPVSAADYGQMMQQLFFAHGSARIGAVDHRHLHVVAQKIRKRSSVAVTVVGHASHRVNTTTDPVRKKEINFEMAQKRANAVTSALSADGVNPSWVMAVSKGDEESNPHPGKRSQEAADRRVEVFVNNGQ